MNSMTALKTKIDKLWTEFWTGGITNPLTVIEQISFLMFSQMLDFREQANERKARRLKGKTQIKMIFNADQQHLRWSQFKNLAADKMLQVVRDEVFKHFKTVGNSGSTFNEYMGDAQLMIQKPSLLVSAVNMIDQLPLEDADVKGDLYEYLLSKLTTAGINGQFRTPRHLIKMMVKLIAPKPTDVICDPACGTGGFLACAHDYIYENNTSEDGIVERENENGQITKIYTGDMLNPDEKDHIQKGMFYGFDFDVTMLRIASMNLILHGLDNPNIHYCDSLSKNMPAHFEKLAKDRFDVVLANPPFKGSLDYDDVDPSLTGKVRTKKTELLFLVLMIRMLKLGGRCALIVPDGVLFGSSNAHKGLRKMLVENNQLEAVISLPSGVFKPYAGVSTAVVVFTKGDPDTEGQTSKVFFYDVQADGYTLDDKRTKIGPEDNYQDMSDVPIQWKEWNSGSKKALKRFEDRTAKAFYVPRKEISDNNYDLSIGRYKEHIYEEVKYDPPKVIIGRLQKLEAEINDDLKELEGMLN